MEWHQAESWWVWHIPGTSERVDMTMMDPDKFKRILRVPSLCLLTLPRPSIQCHMCMHQMGLPPQPHAHASFPFPSASAPDLASRHLPWPRLSS